MIEITTIRLPRAQKIALAVLNTGHPGPKPRGTIGDGYSIFGFKAI